VEDLIVGLYAGFAASVRADPEREAIHRTTAGHDDDVAAYWLRLLDGSPSEVEARLRARASEVVADHWEEIEALADALLEFEVLGQTEAEAVLEASRGDDGAAQYLAMCRQMLSQGAWPY
jgi:hypothetical protein